MLNFYELTDNEIYAIAPDCLRFNDCRYCLCHYRAHLLRACRNCFLCEFKCTPFRHCMWFVPYIFGSEPYKSYFRMTERLHNAKFDLIGRFD